MDEEGKPREWATVTSRLEEIVNMLGDDPEPNNENVSLLEEATELIYWCLDNMYSGRADTDG